VGVAVLFCFAMESTWKLTPSIVEHTFPTSRRSAVVRYVSDKTILSLILYAAAGIILIDLI